MAYKNNNPVFTYQPDMPRVRIGDGKHCTFQDAGDTVTLTAHGLSNGMQVIFTVILTTTGIAINTLYWVVGAGTDTFQVSTAMGGAAAALTTNGTGTVVFVNQDSSTVITNATMGGSIPTQTYDRATYGYKKLLYSAPPDYPSVTFTDASDTVGLAFHGLRAGTIIQFSQIATTTGIAVDTSYYVVNPTLNTFQVSLTEGGEAIVLGGGNGTGVLKMKGRDYKIIAIQYIALGYGGAVVTTTAGKILIFTSDKYGGNVDLFSEIAVVAATPSSSARGDALYTSYIDLNVPAGTSVYVAQSKQEAFVVYAILGELESSVIDNNFITT